MNLLLEKTLLIELYVSTLLYRCKKKLSTSLISYKVMRQYSWLENDLASVNRSITPWVVVYGHRPMYCTNADRDDCTKFETRTRTGLPLTKWWGLEPLLAQYGVDLAVWAHEHSYERLLPTYNRKVVPSPDPGAPYNQPRATVHITTGNVVPEL